MFGHIHSYRGVHAAPKLQVGTPFKPKQAVQKSQWNFKDLPHLSHCKYTIFHYPFSVGKPTLSYISFKVASAGGMTQSINCPPHPSSGPENSLPVSLAKSVSSRLITSWTVTEEATWCQPWPPSARASEWSSGRQCYRVLLGVTDDAQERKTNNNDNQC